MSEPLSNLKRLRFKAAGPDYDGGLVMVDDPAGQFVTYDQAASEIQAGHAEIKRLRALSAEPRRGGWDVVGGENEQLVIEVAQLRAEVERLQEAVGGALLHDRDFLLKENEQLRTALRGLHDDVADYQRINNLGGYDNHWMVAAREALGEKEESGEG